MNIFLHQGDFVYCLFLLVRFTFFGAPSGTRTQDPLIKSQLLSVVAIANGIVPNLIGLPIYI